MQQIDEIEVEVGIAYEVESCGNRLREVAERLRREPFSAVVSELAAINAELSRALAEGIDQLIDGNSY